MIRFLSAVWALARPYWRSEERWSARIALGTLLVIKGATIAVCVQQNNWHKTFYTAIEARDLPAFWSQVGLFCVLAALMTVSLVQSHWVAWGIKTRWRAWMIRTYTNDWLAHQVYYRMQIDASGLRNPDQRISEDIGLFTDRTLDLTVGFLDVLVSLTAFTAILWGLSGTLDVAGYAIPGYMVWAVFAYTLACSWLTHCLGRPLVHTYDERATLEGDYRSSLIRVREAAECIAFHRGEPAETASLAERWGYVYANIWRGLRQERRLYWFTNAYGQFSLVLPFLLAVPKYFSGAMSFPEVMQVTAAFAAVAICLNWFINAYGQIAHWQAEARRLTAFRADLDRRAGERPNGVAIDPSVRGLDVRDLAVATPAGRSLVDRIGFSIPPGALVLIKGASGSGKSTFLRAIAGIWPFASGEVGLDRETAQFLPQKPYLPAGRLRAVLAYPNPASHADEALKAVLDRVGLGHLGDHLDDEADWSQRLSGGEQQRIAFARVFLAQPATVFLDEATSALDEEMEARLYEGLRGAPWRPTVVSIGHRSTLERHHGTTLTLGGAA